MNRNQKLGEGFFRRDVLEVAPDLLGKTLVRRFDDNTIFRSRITQTEAYRGQEDLACHASKGRTARTEIMYHKGGFAYVYLIYGMYWMLNFVTGPPDFPQAVLIRGLADVYGPGRITRQLQVNRSFYGEDLCRSGRIWIEAHEGPVDIQTGPRIGIDYSGDYWKNVPWCFTTNI
jgi:DNA-3-methyladenine glycosylase